jgi:hypothetical protein
LSEKEFITVVEWNTFLKRFEKLEDKINQALTERRKSIWIKKAEAMEMIGCKRTNPREIRQSNQIKHKDSGTGRNIMYQRESVEKYMLENSAINI